MSTSASPQTVPPKAPAPAPVPQYAPPPIQKAPAGDEAPKKRSPWMYAGCGCLVLLVILVVVGFLMDMYMPDVLYAPLRMLGLF
jgi:hypothetical protein